MMTGAWTWPFFGAAGALVLSGAAALHLSGSTVRAATETVNSDGYLMIDGAPRLIIGSYELPADDDALRCLADNGFNLVRADDRAGLDRLRRLGLYGWLCVDPRFDEKDEAARQKLSQTVERAKDHPALLVWELPDEILWNIWYSRVDRALWGEKKALQEEIEKVRTTAPAERIVAWERTLEKAQDLMFRELHEQGESLHDTLWRELGQKNPYPDARLSRCFALADAETEAVARGCRLIRQLDPGRAIWQNHAPRNVLNRLRPYNACVDAAGCDIYPAPFTVGVHSDLKDVTLSAVGAYTDRMRAAAPGKAVWMVLQGFGWRDIDQGIRNAPDPARGRRPALNETRFMAYDALVHDANAILYWGTAFIEKDGELLADLMKVSREIRALEPAIVGERSKRPPVVTADESSGSIDPGDGPRVILRRTGGEWVLVAVNEREQGVSFAVARLPKALEGRALHRLYSEETLTVQGRGFRDGILGYGVNVYATSRRFEASAAGQPASPSS